jgi:hypothetical protein
MPYYLGSFDINYIIFRDIAIFKKIKSSNNKKKLWKKILNFEEIILCVEMKSSKLIN